ncbi:aminotransferase class I/II-fold pyridoxal phosphate-dependent enzyme, partial [Patescibacteria group bacterium]|nr:aminotransferase class I/II-fold pyridoxal phosphate-dependent enzyme [Patescibacteria group bacterium]
MKNILNPFLWGNWKKGPEEQKLIEKFQAYFQGYEAVSFGSGRAALYYLLKSFGVTTGDEVIVQAYTCVSVPNSIVWLGAKPVYVDVRNDFNMDPELIEPAITSKTKVILTQNTFGKPADIRRIKDIAEKHNLILIEDAAHALGAEVASQKIGGFGDGAIFSFGRDKV